MIKVVDLASVMALKTDAGVVAAAVPNDGQTSVRKITFIAQAFAIEIPFAEVSDPKEGIIAESGEIDLLSIKKRVHDEWSVVLQKELSVVLRKSCSQGIFKLSEFFFGELPVGIALDYFDHDCVLRD